MPASAPTASTKQASSPEQGQGTDWKLDVPIPIVAVLITLAGTVLVTWWLGRRARGDRFASATAVFRSAFAADLGTLKDDSYSGELRDFLLSAYRARHAEAVTIFEHHLIGDRRHAFKAEWQCHCYGQHPDGTPQATTDEGLSHEDLLFLHYSAPTIYHKARSAREFAIERIRNLLSYAQET